jgi:hypothetical protein
MALQQLVPIVINLQGDGSSTVFVLSLSSVYQIGDSGSIPFLPLGVIPSSAFIANTLGAIITATVDANGNVTITFDNPPEPGIPQRFDLVLVYDSGDAVSTSPLQLAQPVRIVFPEASGTVPVTGSLFTNSAAPLGNNIGVLPAVASAVAPTLIEGNQVFLSTDLTGALRVNVGSVVASNDITEWAGVTLGSPSNYGTSPGAVTVIGVNAFITNTVPVTLASTTITGTVAVTQSTSPWVIVGAVSAAQSGTWNVGLNAGSNVIGHVITDSGSTTVVTGSVAVTGTFFQAVQPVSGTVTANQGTSPWVVSLSSTTITGTVAVTQSTSPWVVSGTVTANIGTTNGLALDATVSSLQVAQGSTTSGEKGGLVMGAVTTAAPAYTTAQTSPFSLTLAGALRVDGSGVTQPISGAISFTAPQHVINDASAAVIGHVITDATSVTNATLSAETTKVIGTVNQGTSPWVVSLASTTITGNVTVVQPTGTNLHTVVDSGTLTAVTAITNALPAGTNVIGHVINDPAAAASSSTIGSVSLGQSTGKTNVMKTSTLTSTAVTADQVVLTYTVTAAKTFYVEYLNITPRLTAAPTGGTATNPINIGFVSLESPAGTKLITMNYVGPQVEHDTITFPEPIPIAAGTVIRVVCTPDAVTSTQWVANFGGYEK